MDNFNKTDGLYDPNFSIDGKDTGKLDMYGVWLKQKKDIIEMPDDFSQAAEEDKSGKSLHDIHFDDDFSFSGLDAQDNVFETEESGNVWKEEPSGQIAAEDEAETGFSEDTFEALDLDDFFDGSESPAAEDTDSFIDAEPIDIDFTASSHIEPLDNTETPPAGLENFNEIPLEDFEDNVIEVPRETHDELETLETIEEFDPIFEETEPPAVTKRKNINSFDIDITVDDDAHKVKRIEEISAEAAAETEDISIFDADDTQMEAETSPIEAEETPFFDDVEAVEQDLLDVQPDTESNQVTAQTAADTDTAADSVPQSTAAQDRATELLMQIAHEISDLKAELNSLKAGLAIQSHSSTELPEKTAAPQQENSAEEDSVSSGFFSDDDTDETIALTGDELNNILITADFTEEKNADEEDSSEDYEIPEVLTQNIVPDIPDAPEPYPDFEASITEDSELKQHQDAENSSGSTAQQTDGEKLLDSEPVFNVEPVPITSLPDDLSYLDDEAAAVDEQIEIIDDVSMETPEQEEQTEEIDTLEAAQEFEDIETSAFDLPTEQEIQIPQEDTAESTADSAHNTIALSGTHTIHELQKDEDFNNPFEDPAQLSELGVEDEIIEEDFIEEISVPEVSECETAEFVSEEPVEDLTEIPKPYKEEKTAAGKQETLLQAATQIIKGERDKTVSIPLELKNEIKSVLAYMDQLLEALPEKKIEEFAKSEYFETYKHLFEELGIS